MPAAETWTIDHESGGSDGAKLHNCIIEQTAIKTELWTPDHEHLLGTVDSVEAPITFELFHFPTDPDLKFTLTIWTFEWMGRPEAIGPWTTPVSPDKEPQSGDWTAQAGVTPEAESAAAADAS